MKYITVICTSVNYLMQSLWNTALSFIHVTHTQDSEVLSELHTAMQSCLRQYEE
jgi:hypothetical protein